MTSYLILSWVFGFTIYIIYVVSIWTWWDNNVPFEWPVESYFKRLQLAKRAAARKTIFTLPLIFFAPVVFPVAVLLLIGYIVYSAFRPIEPNGDVK